MHAPTHPRRRRRLPPWAGDSCSAPLLSNGLEWSDPLTLLRARSQPDSNRRFQDRLLLRSTPSLVQVSRVRCASFSVAFMGIVAKPTRRDCGHQASPGCQPEDTKFFAPLHFVPMVRSGADLAAHTYPWVGRPRTRRGRPLVPSPPSSESSPWLRVCWRPSAAGSVGIREDGIEIITTRRRPGGIWLHGSKPLPLHFVPRVRSGAPLTARVLGLRRRPTGSEWSGPVLPTSSGNLEA